MRGAGAKLWDADGKEYTDLLGGIAVNALGTAHPAVVEAVSRQIATLGHVSNLFMAEPTIALAERLLRLDGREGGRVFFCNSGAEANEAAFKISRRTGRTHLVALQGAFHGRTMGALALTGQPPSRSRSARCPATSRTSRSATSRRCARPSPPRPRRSSWSRSRARTAPSRCPRAT